VVYKPCLYVVRAVKYKDRGSCDIGEWKEGVARKSWGAAGATL
jgi:hypothetical protein